MALILRICKIVIAAAEQNDCPCGRTTLLFKRIGSSYYFAFSLMTAVIYGSMMDGVQIKRIRFIVKQL